MGKYIYLCKHLFFDVLIKLKPNKDEFVYFNFSLPINIKSDYQSTEVFGLFLLCFKIMYDAIFLNLSMYWVFLHISDELY